MFFGVKTHSLPPRFRVRRLRRPPKEKKTQSPRIRRRFTIVSMTHRRGSMNKSLQTGRNMEHGFFSGHVQCKHLPFGSTEHALGTGDATFAATMSLLFAAGTPSDRTDRRNARFGRGVVPDRSVRSRNRCGVPRFPHRAKV